MVYYRRGIRFDLIQAWDSTAKSPDDAARMRQHLGSSLLASDESVRIHILGDCRGTDSQPGWQDQWHIARSIGPRDMPFAMPYQRYDMNLVSTAALSLAMATDAFAVAIGKGAALQKPNLRAAQRIWLIFGVVEGLTPILGWLLARPQHRTLKHGTTGSPLSC